MVMQVSGIESDDKRTQVLEFYKQYAANIGYHRSYNINSSGIKTEGAYSKLYGEGFGRFSENATGHYNYNQGGINNVCNFELTA